LFSCSNDQYDNTVQVEDKHRCKNINEPKEKIIVESFIIIEAIEYTNSQG